MTNNDRLSQAQSIAQIGVTRPIPFNKLNNDNTLRTGRIYNVTLGEYLFLKKDPLYYKYVLDLRIDKNSTRYCVYQITKHWKQLNLKV